MNKHGWAAVRRGAAIRGAVLITGIIAPANVFIAADEAVAARPTVKHNIVRIQTIRPPWPATRLLWMTFQPSTRSNVPIGHKNV